MKTKFFETRNLIPACALFAVAPLWNATISVDPKPNIFGAGNTIAPGGGLLPTAINFSAGTGQVLTFPLISGKTSYGYPTATIGPDGGPPAMAGTTGSNFNSQGGISGFINDPGNVFNLTAVFLTGSAATTPAPPRLTDKMRSCE
jgi:hypothetical protein